MLSTPSPKLLAYYSTPGDFTDLHEFSRVSVLIGKFAIGFANDDFSL